MRFGWCRFISANVFGQVERSPAKPDLPRGALPTVVDGPGRGPPEAMGGIRPDMAGGDGRIPARAWPAAVGGPRTGPVNGDAGPEALSRWR
ncbi:hypothetical protein GCM10010140_74780 [Streptosporangium pseudovulgare]|uniref:Uncharacterized protein n=1 Tax=Streptosporangium pseudovulgare TaxID=35765 RepID=A0ABQ2RMQ8_9ACTN|nr:hypothetical protein GCM10010140_74780 [Streptosporangium pseudovulgare]